VATKGNHISIYMGNLQIWANVSDERCGHVPLILTKVLIFVSGNLVPSRDLGLDSRRDKTFVNKARQ
jgi:hypothetical protein